jgi:retron-type reverse transcriptase
MVIAKELESIMEPRFHDNSFGYRPKRNAHQAIEQARKNCWNYAWVIDLDIKGFFDNIDHGLKIRALRHFTDEKHIILYAKRWMKAPIQLKDGSQIQNTERGTPQGGVITPVLANIFLHVVFDKWMILEVQKKTWQESASPGIHNNTICPHCKTGRMLVLKHLPRIRSPAGHLPSMLLSALL